MRLLATDLDGTFVGHPDALQELVGHLEQARARWRLAYVTGRSLELGHALQQQEGLPDPDAWVTDVGTVITDAAGVPDAGWQARMQEGWDRARIEAIARSFAALAPQGPEGQGPFKLSYFLEPAPAREVLPALQARFGSAGLEVHPVYSGDRYLDLLPKRGGKGEAVLYLLERFGIGMEGLLACGDSGNDRDMLCLGGPAVAVGNAQAELLADLPESVYRARGHAAAGILEAMAHYGWLAR